MKIFSKKEILPLGFIILVFIISIILFPQLPEKVPSHWNSRGEIDSWAGRGFTVIFFPILILGIYLLMTFMPLIDPLRKNYHKFSSVYFWLKTVFVVFFSLIYLYTLWTAFRNNLDIIYFILPLCSLLFIILGFFIPKIKRNYFVGIRTPWTIHSEEVWNKTHKFSGKIFILAGIISLLAIIIKNYSFLIFIIVVMSAAVVSIAYSYFIFRKIEKFK